MTQPYLVFQITGAMSLEREPMGSKDKFWCRLEPNGPKWLFKQPRRGEDNIEHVSEKVAQEIADIIEMPCAAIELAQSGDARGTISRDICQTDEALVHGNEIIAGRVTGYARNRQRRSSDHTFEHILRAINEVCGGHCQEDVRQLAGYLVLDALIGNTDRHHENWGLLRRDDTLGPSYRLAPSFDHASSLGREMLDSRRELLLRDNRIENYLLNGRGGIYLADRGASPIAPIKLVEILSSKMPEAFDPWITRIENVTTDRLDHILTRIPDGWISDTQRRFAKALVLQSRQMLSGFRR